MLIWKMLSKLPQKIDNAIHEVTTYPCASSKPGWQNSWHCLTYAIYKHKCTKLHWNQNETSSHLIDISPNPEWHLVSKSPHTFPAPSPSPISVPPVCFPRLSWNFLLQNLLANDSTPACNDCAANGAAPAKRVQEMFTKKHPSVPKRMLIQTWAEWNQRSFRWENGEANRFWINPSSFLLKAMSRFTGPKLLVPKWMGKDSTMTSRCEMHEVLHETWNTRPVLWHLRKKYPYTSARTPPICTQQRPPNPLLMDKILKSLNHFMW